VFLVSLHLSSVSDTLWTLAEGKFLKFLVIREVQLLKKKTTEERRWRGRFTWTGPFPALRMSS
jgi:hypothetical protein